MKILILACSFLLLTGCHNKEHNSHSKDEEVDKEHEHGNDRQKDSLGGEANEFMHRSSMENLIDRFESPERDAYQKPEKVLEYLGDIQGKTIMDIGAGSGYFSVKLAEKGANVIAADVDEEFQEFLRKRIQENNLENIELRKIPYDSPGLKEKEADMVFIVNTYHHIEDRSAYFSGVKKGTKEQGYLLIIDFFKSEVPVGPPTDHKVSMDVVITELKKSGYSNFEVDVNLLPYQYMIKAY